MGEPYDLVNEKPRDAVWEFLPGWMRAAVNYTIVAAALTLFGFENAGGVSEGTREAVRSVGISVVLVAGSVYIPFGMLFRKRR